MSDQNAKDAIKLRQEARDMMRRLARGENLQVDRIGHAFTTVDHMSATLDRIADMFEKAARLSPRPLPVELGMALIREAQYGQLAAKAKKEIRKRKNNLASDYD